MSDPRIGSNDWRREHNRPYLMVYGCGHEGWGPMLPDMPADLCGVCRVKKEREERDKKGVA